MVKSVASATSSSRLRASETAKCRRCKRPKSLENPCPRKYPQHNFLPFVSERSLDCIPCERFCKRHCFGLSKDELIERLKDPKHQEQYDASLKDFEEELDASKGYGKSSIAPPEFVNVVNKSGLLVKQNGGVFWPKTLWEREFPQQELPKKDCVKYTVKKGTTHSGIWRDKKHGEPQGT